MSRLARTFPGLFVLLFLVNPSNAHVGQRTEGAQTNKVTKAAENSARELIKRGNALHRKAEYQAAIEYYSRIDASAGELYARAKYNTGVCYYEMYRTEDAIAMYKLAIRLSSRGYPNASYALGVALEDLKRPAEAKQAFHTAIHASKGDHALAYFRLGVITGADDPETAAMLFREAIARSRDGLPAGHNNLGVMLARRGRLLEAQREFEIALRQTKGQMPEAQHNVQLCQSLLKTRPNAQVLTRLILK